MLGMHVTATGASRTLGHQGMPADMTSRNIRTLQQNHAAWPFVGSSLQLLKTDKNEIVF
jgi:hypothetical protein